MAMRAGGYLRKPPRPKTIDHIERDLLRFIAQARWKHLIVPPTRRELRAAKQALVIIQQVKP